MRHIGILITLSTILSANLFTTVKQVGSCYPRSQTINTQTEFIELTTYTKKAAKKYHLSESILYAIFEQESNFRYQLKHRWVWTSIRVRGKWRRRRTRALGLGGIIYGSNPDVLRRAGIRKKDLLTIRGNVIATAAVLRYKINRTGSLYRGLRAYYGGGSRYPRQVIQKSHKYKRRGQ